VFNFR
ncbi:hypothetical protein FOXB_03730, partial [Fusarium oxysporum f. sp. conglutinans Fo5176]